MSASSGRFEQKNTVISLTGMKVRPGKMAGNIQLLLLTILLFVTAGCGQTINSGRDSNQKQQSTYEEEKEVAQERGTVKKEKPPIDLEPEKLETATFALG